jgi:hypothetical protein
MKRPVTCLPRALPVTLVLAGLSLAAAVASAQGPEGEPSVSLPPAATPPAAPPTSGTLLPTPPDSVYLRGGGLVRGRVHEVIPGDHITISLDTGDKRVIPWAEVDRVVIASASSIPPVGTPAAPGAPSLPSVPMRGPLVRVHITSPRAMQLYRRLPGTSEWAHACESPCDAELPLGDEYRVTGGGNGGTKEFRLEGQPGGTVEIALDPPAVGGMVAGGLLGGVGGMVLYVASLTWLGASAAESTDCAEPVFASQCSSDRGLRDGSLVAMGLGTAAMVLGIVIVVNASRTDVVQHPATTEPSQAAFLREPTWHSAPIAPAGGSMMMPIFGGRF